jgi:hypothetical protein
MNRIQLNSKSMLYYYFFWDSDVLNDFSIQLNSKSNAVSVSTNFFLLESMAFVSALKYLLG